MHIRLLLTTAILFSGYALFAQDNIPLKIVPNEIFRSVKKENDTVPWKWKRGGLINMNLAQGSLSNWAAGGDKFSMSVNSYFNYYWLNKGRKHTWDNSVDVNFGLIKTTSLGTRKNDDRLDVLSKYGLRFDSSKWYATALFNFRTQFFDGLGYSGDSSYLTSTFLSPAYIVLSTGFDYKPFESFSLFLSPLTNRTTIVASNRLYAKGLYGVQPYHHYLNQTGAFASLNFAKPIFKNVSYRGRLDLFSDYGHNPGNIDVFYTNVLNFKVNKFLSASYALDMIYDDDVKLFGKFKTSPGLQLKSLIGIGFSMPIATAIMN